MGQSIPPASSPTPPPELRPVLNFANAVDGWINSGRLTVPLSGAKTVEVVIGPQSYTAEVSNETWALPLTNDMARGLAQGDQTVTARSLDANGDPVAQVDLNVTIDTISPQVSLETAPVVINQAGLVQGVGFAGQTDLDGQSVTVTVGAKSVVALVQDGQWSAKLMLEAADLTGQDLTVLVQAVDQSGNLSSAQMHRISVDITAPNLQVSELGSRVVLADFDVTGQAVDDSLDAVIVQIFFDDIQLFQADVQLNDAGRFQARFAADDLAGLLDETRYEVRVTATDQAGNVTVDAQTVTLDLTAPELILDQGDRQLDATDLLDGFVLRGSTDAETGQRIVAGIAGQSIYADVEAGRFALALDPAVLATLPAGGAVPITVSATDHAGNETVKGISLTRSTAALSFDDAWQDAVLGGADVTAPLTITGRSYGISIGQDVFVTLGKTGQIAQGVIDAAGGWSVTFAPFALIDLPQQSAISLQATSAGAVQTETLYYVPQGDFDLQLQAAASAFDFALNAAAPGQATSGQLQVAYDPLPFELQGVRILDETGVISTNTEQVGQFKLAYANLTAAEAIAQISLRRADHAQVDELKFDFVEDGLSHLWLFGTDGVDDFTGSNLPVNTSGIRAMAGDDRIDLHQTAQSTVWIEQDAAENRQDLILGFTKADQLVLSAHPGAADGVQVLAAGQAVDPGTGLIVLVDQLVGLEDSDFSDLAAQLDRGGPDDPFYVMASNGQDAALAHIGDHVDILAIFSGLDQPGSLGDYDIHLVPSGIP